MTKALFVKGTNIAVQGTLERLSGVALATTREADGTPIYEGETKVWWDEQETVTDDDDRIIWVGDDGELYDDSQIEEREVEQ